MIKTSKHLKFSVFGVVVPQGRPRFSTRNGYPIAYDPPKSKAYKQKIFEAFWYAIKIEDYERYEQKNEPLFLTNPVGIKITEHRQIPKSWSKIKKQNAIQGLEKPVTRPDLDNVTKIVLDALNGHAWHDDGQVIEIYARKIYDLNPRLEIEIYEISETGEQSEN